MLRRFWKEPLFIAFVAATGMHGLAFAAVLLICVVDALGYVPPQALIAYGNSSLEGLSVDTVALDSGTLRQGEGNTPGGDDAPPAAVPPAELPKAPPKETPAKEEPEKPPEPDKPATEKKETPPPPASAASAEKEKEKKKPSTGTDDKPAQLPGAPGGSRLNPGTPSAGGTVGSSTGVRMIGAARPTYPREAIQRGLEGLVILYLEVSAEGQVTEVKLHRSSGHAILDEAALAHGRKLRFIPARQHGQPVAATALSPVRFRLE